MLCIFVDLIFLRTVPHHPLIILFLSLFSYIYSVPSIFVWYLAATTAVQDEFRENDEMPTERFRAAAVNVTEHVYLFGGRDVAGNLVRCLWFRFKRHESPDHHVVPWQGALVLRAAAACHGEG